MESTELAMMGLFMSKNPIDNYYKGMPCMLGETVGKIIGEIKERLANIA